MEIESSTFDPLEQARKSKVCVAWGVAAFVERQEMKIKRARSNPVGEAAMNEWLSFVLGALGGVGGIFTGQVPGFDNFLVQGDFRLLDVR